MKSHATIELHCICNELLLPTIPMAICNILHSDERSANGQPVGQGQSRKKGRDISCRVSMLSAIHGWNLLSLVGVYMCYII